MQSWIPCGVQFVPLTNLYQPMERKPKDFAILTNVLTKAWSGMTTGEYKRHKGLTKDRVVYSVFESIVEVSILQMVGHYDDK